MKDTSRRFDVPPLELSVAASAPVLVVESPSWWTSTRTARVVAGAIGGAALLTGGVLALVARGTYEDARQRCPESIEACRPGAADDANRAFALAGIATGTVIGGAVVTAAGVGLVLLSPEPARAATRVNVGLSSVSVSRTW